MKKMYYLLLMICTLGVFAACSDDDNENTPDMPVSEIKVPGSAEAAADVTIGGKGFNADSKIFLEDKNGKSVEATVKTYTSVDLVFTIPESLPAGTYTVVLKQEGNWELGKITITAKRPVTDYTLPAEAVRGMVAKVTGKGFAEDCKIYLESDDLVKTEMANVELFEEGVKFTVPKDLAGGTYTLYLEQDGSWALGTLKVVTDGPKLLAVIEMKEYYMDTEGNYMPEEDDNYEPIPGSVAIVSESTIELEYDGEARLHVVEFISDYSGHTWTVEYPAADKVTLKDASASQDDQDWFESTTEYTLEDGMVKSYERTHNSKVAKRVDREYIYFDSKAITSGTISSSEGYLTGIESSTVTKTEGDPEKTNTSSSKWVVSGSNFTSLTSVNEYQEEESYAFDYTGGFTNVATGIDLWALLSKELGYSDFDMRLLGIAGKYPAQLPGKITGQNDYSEMQYKLEYKKDSEGRLTELRIYDTNEDNMAYGEYYDVFVYTLEYKSYPF